MTQKRLNTYHSYFYRDHLGIRRRYGIYMPAVDRFLHISEQDMWMSLETAEILSSKVQTMLYVLPPGYVKVPEYTDLVNNANCLNWGIYNKSNLKIGSGSVLGARQTPTIGMLYPDDTLEEHTVAPEEFKEDNSILVKLKDYADYVYKRVTGVSIAVNAYNPYFSKKFIEKYIDDDWVENKKNSADPTFSKGIEFEIKKILYQSNSKEEAEEAITNFWLGNYRNAGFIMVGYYRVLGEPIPEKLKSYASNIHYLNHSVWVI
jgi:hypothetical protein